LSNLVLNVFKNFNTVGQLEDVKNFMQQKIYLGVAKKAFVEAIETIGINVMWVEKNSEEVINWLNEKNRKI
jgi:hypothetical protein